MKRAIYSGGSFKPLDAPDLSEGGGMIVLLDVPRQNRRRPYVRCRFEGELLVPDAPVTSLKDGEEVEYYDAVVAELEQQERAFDEMEWQWEEYAARHGGNPPEVPSVENRGIARPVDARSPVDAFRAPAKEARPFAHPIRFVRIKRGTDGNDR